MPVVIRRALAGDQAAIADLVRAARLNRRELDWRRFVVAEDAGQVIGAGQVRLYPDGSRELASGVVRPAYRGRGVGRRLIEALLAAETGPVYVLAERQHAGHFARLGFRPVEPAALPPGLARTYRRGRLATALASLLGWRRIRIVPLRRDAAP
jgi:N-acetylglutamate synthase-like GNAT family acetyltransferase